MMKKIAALAGAGALLLGAAVPVFAHSWDWAYVNNSAVAVADTGGNSQSNIAEAYYYSGATVYGGSGARTMYTGDADAYAGALVVANTHIDCGLCSSRWHTDSAQVTNGAGAYAYTGDNGQDDVAFADYSSGATTYGSAGARYMDTGSADSEVRAWTIVNTHWGW